MELKVCEEKREESAREAWQGGVRVFGAGAPVAPAVCLLLFNLSCFLLASREIITNTSISPGYTWDQPLTWSSGVPQIKCTCLLLIHLCRLPVSSQCHVSVHPPEPSYLRVSHPAAAASLTAQFDALECEQVGRSVTSARCALLCFSGCRRWEESSP